MADGAALNYTPSALPGAPPAPTPSVATPYAPSALPGAQPSVYQPSQLDIIAHVESGNRNIPQAIHDVNTDRGTPAGGNFQFIDPTWRRQALKAGIDINRYPTAMSAPPSVQAQVAAVTPIREWGPNTVAALKAHYPNLDTSKPPTGPYNGAAVGGAPATAAPPAQPANVGSALAALTQPGESGIKSTMDNLQQIAGGGGGGQQAPPPLDLQSQQAASAMGNARQAQIAAMAPQLMLAARQMGGLHGIQSPAQTQAFMGGQVIPMPGPTATPGTTLNSTGGLYG